MEPKFKDEIVNKFLKGLEYSFRKLVEDKKRQDGTFVFSVDGKIVHVKARDIELK